MSREDRRRQTRRKLEKKQRQRARAVTQRQRNQARTALRVEKATGRDLENTEPSEANEVFAEGLSAYREYKEEYKVDLIADKIYDLYKRAPKNRFYVRLYGNRPMRRLEFVRRANEGLANFEILYKGNGPEEDFYFSFFEDEYDYDDETHRVSYYTVAEQHAPFLYFAVLFDDQLTHDEQRLLYNRWDYATRPSNIWETPLEFLKNFSPGFKKVFDKEMVRYAVYRQKVASLPEKAITSFLERGEEASGRPLPENVEARIRSMISTRPFARNYSGVTNNFSRINTSLFN